MTVAEKSVTPFLGVTTTSKFALPSVFSVFSTETSPNCRKTSRSHRLIRFRTTAFPIFFDTVSPRRMRGVRFGMN